MDRYTLTAYIRCYKDPELVLKCASRLLWADEIVIADNSDNTSVKDIIAQIEHTNVKYFNTDITDFRLRLNSLKDKITSDFILIVDTDEFYCNEAAVEIQDILTGHSDVKDGYIVPSESFGFGEYVGKGADQLRLVKKEKFYFEFVSIHEMPKVNGSVGKIKYGYDHFNSPSFYNISAKPFNYAKGDARTLNADQLEIKRLDKLTSWQIKKHFILMICRLLWRSRQFFFHRNRNFVDLWLRYLDIITMVANNTGATDEIRLREGKEYKI